jgi:hypothetical protein
MDRISNIWLEKKKGEFPSQLSIIWIDSKLIITITKSIYLEKFFNVMQD